MAAILLQAIRDQLRDWLKPLAEKHGLSVISPLTVADLFQSGEQKGVQSGIGIRFASVKPDPVSAGYVASGRIFTFQLWLVDDAKGGMFDREDVLSALNEDIIRALQGKRMQTLPTVKMAGPIEIGELSQVATTESDFRWMVPLTITTTPVSINADTQGV